MHISTEIGSLHDMCAAVGLRDEVSYWHASSLEPNVYPSNDLGSYIRSYCKSGKSVYAKR